MSTDSPGEGTDRVGHEHRPLAPPKTPFSKGSGAESDAHDAPSSARDLDLIEIVAVWPELPEHIRAAIMALVKTQLSRPEGVDTRVWDS